jgi:two-component system response regulator PhcR
MKSDQPFSRQPSPDADAVLLVDDEPQALKWFSRQYGDEFRVLTASGAAQALELLERRAHEVAVLLTDYRMPVQDGVTLLEAARERFGHVSRLLMSAYADKDVAMAAVNQGQVDQILEKPLDEGRTREVLRAAREACQRRLREQALLQRRDDTLRDTLGFLAHEVGTPLATVSGYLSAMRERQQHPVCGNTDYACLSQRNPGEFQAMLEAAQRRTDYTQSLVASFVRTARDAYHADGSASERASDLVRSVCQDYPLDGEESDWLAFELQHDFVLPGQRDLLYLVLCTLVKNAVLALRAQRPAEPCIRVVVECGTGGAVIRVSDNGPGIAPELLSRLTLEPVTTRADCGGHGMGLVFCQRVMTALGGRVEVRSQQGHGASVGLYFKVREEEQAHEVFQ